jgi:DNA-binding transcriptional regulator PaaX
MGKYLKYKGATVNPFGLLVPGFNKKDIKKSEKSGKRYYQYRCFEFNYKVGSPRNLVVMYDIPNDKRKERNWFRRHLHKFGYIMIQKSVWVGPSPLPKEFLNYVKVIGLANQLVTLKLAKPYLKGDKNI